MSIIGEMWEEEYDKLKSSIPITLIKFAEWLEREGYRSIGYNMWITNPDDNYWGQKVYFTTEQLVKKFQKELKIN